MEYTVSSLLVGILIASFEEAEGWRVLRVFWRTARYVQYLLVIAIFVIGIME